MTRSPEPLASRNFAVFLIALASLVIATPFADRNDSQGWVAFIVMIAAIVTLLTMWFCRTAQNVLDWWRDDLD